MNAIVGLVSLFVSLMASFRITFAIVVIIDHRSGRSFNAVDRLFLSPTSQGILFFLPSS